MTVHAKALHRAAEIVGGREKLRTLLDVSVSEIEAWMAGAERPPMDVFLKAVDIISAAPPPNIAPVYEAVLRSRQMRRSSEVLRLATERTRRRSVEIQAAILAGREAAGRPRGASALAFLNAKFEPADGRAMVETALDVAIASTGADMGNVQLRCADALRIVAQRGFEAPFLEFFGVVREDDDCSCGRALRHGERMVVPDVARDPIFAGKACGAVMEKARARAVQSTPMLAASGQLLGVLSTHYYELHRPDERELDLIDNIARRTAFWLDGGAL